MSKPIKLSDETYEKIDRLRGKGETFNDVVESLLEARIVVFHALNMLEGCLKYEEFKKEQIAKAFHAADPGRAEALPGVHGG